MAEKIKKSDISENDIYKLVRDSADKTLKIVDKLNKELIESAKISSKIVTKSSKLKEAKEIRAVQNEIKLSNFRMKEAIKLDAEKVRISTQKMKAERLQAAEIKRTAEAQRKQAQATKTQNSEYTKLVKKTRDLKNESKRLAAEMLTLEASGRKSTKEYRQLAGQYAKTTRSAQKFDKTLKKIDSRVGDNFRSVGNYGKALGGLKNMLLQFGAGLGIARIGKSVIGTIAKFEQATANLSAVLGKTPEQITALTEDAKRLGEATAFSATEVAQLQTNFAKLGFKENEIIAATGATLDLAAATGTDLAEAAQVAGGTLGGFQLNADQTGRVADVMAKSFSISALDMENFTESMKNAAPAANAVGLSVEETTALLGTLSKANITGSKAGSNLSTGFINLKAKGLELNEALKQIKGSADPLTTAVELVGKNAAKSFLILANGQETTKGLTEELLKAEGAAAAMAKTQLNTMGGALQLLNSAWEGQILKMDEAGGVADKLKTAIQFLAKNLSTILSVLVMVAKAFVTYKIAMAALNLRQQIKLTLEHNASIKETGKATGEATTKTAGFRKALKGIGFAIAISLAIELVTQFWNIVSGADAARAATDRYNKALANGKDLATDVVKKEEEKLKVGTQNAKLQLAQGKISQEQYDAEIKRLNTLFDSRLRSERSISDSIKKANKGNKAIEAEQNAILKVIIAAQKERASAALDVEIAELSGNETTKKTTEALKQQNEQLKLKKANLDDLLAIEKEIADEEKQALDRLNREVELGEAITDANKQMQLSQMSEEEREVQAVKDSFRRRLDLAEEMGFGRKEIEEQMLNEINDVRTKFAQKEIEAQKALDKIQADLDAEAAKERIRKAKEVQQLLTDFFIKNSEKKIAQLDKEIEAAEKQQSALEELAKNGNITAQQSLKENQRIINEANKQKLKEQKRQERIKLAETVFDVYASKVEAGDKTPLVSTISDVALLRAFIDSLPSFDVGSDRLGENGKGIDNKGGFLAINHPDEQILTAEQNKRTGFMGAEDKTKLTEAYLSGSLVSRSADGLTAGYNVDLQPLVKEMQEVKTAINNIETSSVDVQGITQSWISIVERIKKGNKITNNVHKFRSDA